MGQHTTIAWCHSTFNPWRGCTKVSPGCTNCYAETMSRRNPKVLGVWGDNGTRVVASEAKWKEPLKWDRLAKEAGERHRVFCASLSDVFEDWKGPMVDAKGAVVEGVTMNLVRCLLWGTIRRTPNLDWLLLTKRPDQAATWARANPPPENVWVGTTVENRAAKARIDVIRSISAKIRFLSIEPLIEDLGELDLRGINWVIVGGESGSKARPFDIEWARSIRDQCKAAGVACFVKQLGAKAYQIDPDPRRGAHNCSGEYKMGRLWLDLRDSHGGDWSEWPEDLRVREVPDGKAV